MLGADSEVSCNQDDLVARGLRYWGAADSGSRGASPATAVPVSDCTGASVVWCRNNGSSFLSGLGEHWAQDPDTPGPLGTARNCVQTLHLDSLD